MPKGKPNRKQKLKKAGNGRKLSRKPDGTVFIGVKRGKIMLRSGKSLSTVAEIAFSSEKEVKQRIVEALSK
jgi:hypothetical protein